MVFMGNHYVFLTQGAQTKFDILHAFDRPIEQITVTQICNNCHISRPTFYSHFNSKYSVAFWMLDLSFDLYLNQIGKTLKWSTGVIRFFDFLYEERNSLPFAFSKNPSRADVEPSLENRREKVKKTLMDHRDLAVTNELGFYIDFFVNVGNFVTAEWCQDGMPQAPDVLAQYFTTCMPRPLIDILDKSVEEPYDLRTTI